MRRTIVHAVRDGGREPRIVRLNPDYGAPDAATLDPFTAPVGDSNQGRDDEPDEDPSGDGNPSGERDPFRHPQVATGEDFIFAVQAEEPAIWGRGAQVLWAPGEALIFTGPPGVGKTTITQQLVLARVGLVDTFLGFPVQPTSSKVLYLAMDRPRQIARSMRRMVDDGDRQLLAARLVVWKGPLPADAAARPDILLQAARAYGADTIIVDSVKDASVGLVGSEQAGLYNRARQRALAEGIEIVEIAHQRKHGANQGAPKTLQDMHGGMELSAGAGSVFLVWGQAGDLVVELNHLKQPAEMVGPLLLVHDHDAGRTEVEKRADAGDVMRLEPWKIWTPVDLAAVLSESTGKPSRGDVERVRRKVEKLATEGLVVRVPGEVGRNGKPEVRYRWAQTAPDTTWGGS
ncbi:AAA family ATPase [Pseudonocardia hispaniensis]|uniref:AAA family ATPase n=1 Tax=Pseudonocardia hispaniensis TaxID=904933 RepID=A0ABW1J8Y6_9PSEU